MQTDHIAFLVRNIEAISQRLPDWCFRHPIEEQPAEGTREQYITFEDDKIPAILLMQAISDGPYLRSMAKRGPGLHHIGCVCNNFLEEVTFSGANRLFLHPISIKTQAYNTIWLCRPGFPTLIELIQNPEQAIIPGEKAILQFPAEIQIPGYAGGLFGNLILENHRESSFGIKGNGIELKLDPNLS